MPRITDPDQLYVNYFFRNDVEQSSTPCTFTDLRSRPYIEDASKFMVTLTDFSFSAKTMPMRKFVAGVSSVTLYHEASGSVFTAPVDFINEKGGGGTSGFIYTPETLLEMYNIAFQTALAMLLQAHPGFAPVIAPELSISGGLCSLTVPAGYHGVVSIYTDALTNRLFTGVALTIQAWATGSATTPAQKALQYQWIVDATHRHEYVLNGSAPTDFYRMTQVMETVKTTWWVPRKLLIEVGGLGTVSELMPDPHAGDSTDLSENLLTHFHLTADSLSSGGDIFTFGGAHLWNTMSGGHPIENTSASVHVVYQDGQRVPLLFEQHDAGSIRLLFRKTAIGTG
jgi:hypothetical protein